MESSIARVKYDLDAATTFLDQYLHLANCHMVEFFTESHWDKLLPKKLRNYLDVCELSEAVDNFWKYADGNYCDGRNARMLAAQSIHRVVYNKQIPDKGLLYRALIQVIIKQRFPDLPVSEGKLKGISSKCQNFDDYVKMADAILKIGVDQNSETYYEIQKDIDIKWKKIVMFYLLRLCLAQVIENVILLDRLLFLLENGFQKCYLVKLFDPVTSPRCHELLAQSQTANVKAPRRRKGGYKAGKSTARGTLQLTRRAAMTFAALLALALADTYEIGKSLADRDKKNSVMLI
ncbi:unnamed protein product [Danaus chrysippus]|uniref:(African queen) hypothetical protein n=1 Tax=Danaus chrysippus TaxID=151541 RepID=A0A8J2R5U1_9NEOP|nr:unnamed protein product [Danaus chrysippus]